MPPRLTEIDDLLARDHHHLSGGEGCYFLREYTSGAGYAASDTNDLISNLKKSPRVRDTLQWRHKERAIQQAAGELVAPLLQGWQAGAVLVPMPPSKTKDHPEYDDRMLQVLRRMEAVASRLGLDLDVRSLLAQARSLDAAHQGGPRLNPSQLEELLEVDEAHADPPPERIALVDDVLTTGSHFVAARRVLTRRFGEVPVLGLFVARRVFPEADQRTP